MKEGISPQALQTPKDDEGIYEHFYTHKFDNSEEIDQFLKKYK